MSGSPTLHSFYVDIEKKINTIDSIFKNSSDDDQREKAIDNMGKLVNDTERILSLEMPDYYWKMFQGQLTICKQNYETYKKNFKWRVIADGQGNNNGNTNKNDKGNKANDSEDQKLKKNLEGTILQETPNVLWTDIAGLESQKEVLIEAVILPYQYDYIFGGKIKPWKGILLYGPPGTGKTYLAKACATQCKSKFFSVSSADLMSKYQGESERMVKQLFQLARENEPSIIFIDEIDSIAGWRGEGENESSRRVKNELLTQLEGIGNNNQKVFIMGATNLPWDIDSAIQWWFDKRVMIPLPDQKARNQLLRIEFKDTENTLTDDDYQQAAIKTEGFSGSDLHTLCNDTAMQPLYDALKTDKFVWVNVKGKMLYMPVPKESNRFDFQGQLFQLEFDTLYLGPIESRNLMKTLSTFRPSIVQNDLQRYQEYTLKYGIE